jgi:MoaA/NifB/PqqE/SkfB family radical SAM enzyme
MKALYKPMLLAGMLSGAYNPVGPYLVNMDLTHRCNLNCPWCRYHSIYLQEERVNKGADRDIKLEHFDSACRDLAAMGSRTVQFVGRGESFLHPEFDRLTQIVKGYGLEVRLFTNGTLLDQERVEQLVANQVDEIVVALWASNKERYTRLHGQEAAERFDTVLAGIERLNREKAARNSVYPRIMMGYALTPTALDDLEGMLELAQKHKMQGITLSVASVGKELGAFRPDALDREGELEAIRCLKKLAPAIKSSGLQYNLNQVLPRLELGEFCWRKVPCNVGWFFSNITVEGEVHACNRHSTKMGDLSTQSFKSIWNSEPYRRFRKLSRDPKNLINLSEEGDCNHCCHLPHNFRIHQVLRWWPPARGSRL